jgi:hypothetical protein
VKEKYTCIEGLRARIDAEGGAKLREGSSAPSVREFAESHGFAPRQVYSWRSRDIAVPVELLGAAGVEPDHIVTLKGSGRSLQVRNPKLPFQPCRELLTRIQESVHRDETAAPVYITDDRGNLERFQDLLSELGDVETTVYDRERRYQLRYPSFLDSILRDRGFEPVFSALVDESGFVGERYLKAGSEKIRIDEFDEELYSVRKKYRLAAARGDALSETIQS